MNDLAPASIGIIGGTFDPIHIGHLQPALEVQRFLGLEQLRVVPCHLTSHRAQPERSAQVRSHMVKLAVSEWPNVEIDERELQRDSLSYTIDSLTELRAEYPHAALFFLLGADSFDSFQQWHRWQDILDLATLVVMARPGSSLNEEASRLMERNPSRIVVAPTTELRISSTAIRALLARGGDPHYLLPPAVRTFVLNEKIYLDNT